jgi:hypothetical protein
MTKIESKIMAVLYSWGEFREEEEINREDLKDMDELEEHMLLGFDIRKEDKGKTFYADPDYIDEGADGTAVKYAYAIKENGKRSR